MGRRRDDGKPAWLPEIVFVEDALVDGTSDTTFIP